MNTSIQEGFERTTEVLTEQGFRPLFLSVKGSVLYDMPGSHKDLDIRGIYAAKTSDALSLRKPQQTLEVMEGDLDIVCWEVEKFLGHLLRSNGNMIEMLLAPEDKISIIDSTMRGIIEVAKKYLTKQLYFYYRGFAHNQFKRSNQQMKTGKGMVYTYREMYAGIWLMKFGGIIYPWVGLKDSISDEGIFKSNLIDELTMDREKVEPDMLTTMAEEFEELDRILTESYQESLLPNRYDGYAKFNDVLLSIRSANWR